MLKKILKSIDNFLNRTTMYRLVLYYLFFLIGVAIVLGLFDLVSVKPLALLLSTAFLLAACWVLNKIFSYFFGAPANTESMYISALILALIITPDQPIRTLMFLSWASVFAMASKYIITIKRKHIFNPAAFAVVLTAITIGYFASWWVATPIMAPFIILGGVLLVRKIRRTDLVLSYFTVSFITIFSYYLYKNGFGDLPNQVSKVVFDSPMLFFGFVMLTEPLTTPPTKGLRILYGALTGFVFAPQIHIGGIYSTPESALLVGNLFSYLVSPKQKLMLKLETKIDIAKNTENFIFKTEEKLDFKPGQYLEWTLPLEKPDTRGNRRYFTIASSPTESDISVGVKFYDKPSAFKETMSEMKTGDSIVVSQLAGDFTMPKDINQKLVFIAGGIGITPFRSMIKYLLDMNEKRDIVLFYSNNTEADIAYKDIFDMAETKLGIKTVYTLTDKNTPPPSDWGGRVGFVDDKMIKEAASDWQERIFYISGPNVMVDVFKETLKKMGLNHNQIK